jgi:hypothetical protein
MRLCRVRRSLLACLGLVLLATTARADAPPDPLRLVPADADLVVVVQEPRHLVEAVLTLPKLQALYQLQPVQEYRDSTSARRLQQLVAYAEKELGAKWPALLDRLAGGGAVLAGKFGSEPGPALLVVQGTDDELMARFARLALALAEQELARQGSRDRPEKRTYRGVETVHVGKGVHAAVAGKALLLSNVEARLQHALDLHLDGPGKSMAGNATVGEARRLLPGAPAALVWINMDTVRNAPQAKDVYALPRDNAILTNALGGVLDVLGRSPFACAGLYVDPDGLAARFRLPRGRDGSAPALATHIPPSGCPGSRPLLEPRGVLYSQSYYLDLSKFWENREQLFTKLQVKSFEDFDKNSGRFLAGNRLSQLFAQAGPYQRLVAVHQPKSGYKVAPKTQIPAFAFVVEMRRPEEFPKAMEAVLRGAALLAGTQVRLKLTEEKHGTHTLVGYRFPEDGKFPADVGDFRFNFSPCFCAVGNQFFVSSTLDLGHELIDLLDQEAAQGSDRGSPSADQTQLYSKGGAEFLQSIEDILLTQAVLDQALSPDEARRQVKTFVDLVRHVGVLQRDIGYGANDFHYDVRLILEK